MFPFADDSLHSPADNFTTQYFLIGYTRGNSWTKRGEKRHTIRRRVRMMPGYLSIISRMYSDKLD